MKKQYQKPPKSQDWLQADLAALHKLSAPKLGAILDQAERDLDDAVRDGLTIADPEYEAIVVLFNALKHAYFGKVRRPIVSRHYLSRVSPTVAATATLGPPTDKPVSINRWHKALLRYEAAQLALDLLDLDGEAYYTTRQHCDATATAEHAEQVEEILWSKFSSRKKAFKDARKAGTLKRSLKAPTGYKPTGKFVIGHDGVKVPIMEKE